MKFLGVFLSLVVGVVLSGLVLVKMWVWFVMPLGITHVLSAPNAIGLSILASYMTYQSDAVNAENEKEETIKTCLRIILRPLTVLLVAWVVTLFMCEQK